MTKFKIEIIVDSDKELVSGLGKDLETKFTMTGIVEFFQSCFNGLPNEQAQKSDEFIQCISSLSFEELLE